MKTVNTNQLRGLLNTVAKKVPSCCMCAWGMRARGMRACVPVHVRCCVCAVCIRVCSALALVTAFKTSQQPVNCGFTWHAHMDMDMVSFAPAWLARV